MRTAALIVNENKENFQEHLDKAKSILQKIGIEIAEPKNADFFVVLGGDGTMLGSIRRNAQYGIPFLGINNGHLGFLTEELEDFEKALSNYSISKRWLMNVKFNNQEQVAVNDIVLQRQPRERMLKINVFVNDSLVNFYKADGVILSTPTGSTAYSLSAGGSVVEPGLEIVQIAPICAHQLSARPIVLSMNNKIRITNDRDELAELVIDGQEFFNIAKGEAVEITKGNSFELMHLENHSFYDRIKEKLK